MSLNDRQVIAPRPLRLLLLCSYTLGGGGGHRIGRGSVSETSSRGVGRLVACKRDAGVSRGPQKEVRRIFGFEMRGR